MVARLNRPLGAKFSTISGKQLNSRSKTMKPTTLLLGALLLAAICLVQPQRAQASLATAVLCSGAEFPCLPADTLDSGFRTNNVGVLLANRYTLLPFVFDDAFASFSGNMLAVDSQGKFVYLWGGGVATNKFGSTKLWLDVQLSQSYTTVAGNWGFSEFNSGGCNAAATGAGDTVLATSAINGATPLPVLNGVCSPFNVSGGPVVVGVGNPTNLTALAQFAFNAGAANQQVNLPWGLDFPDPAITIFPDPNNLPAGFTEQATPEPTTLVLMATGSVLSLLRRKR
jgi:PEP-CTERM motif